MSCQICGEKSGYYPLCSDCFKLRDEGKVSKCPNCEKWFQGEYFFCKSCYYELKDDKKAQIQLLRDLYFDIRDKASEMANEGSDCQMFLEKMGKVANRVKNCGDSYLTNRTDKDVNDISKLLKKYIWTDCEICGNNSRGKPLCYDCYLLAEDGIFTECNKCGKWKSDDLPLCYDCWRKAKGIKSQTPKRRGAEEAPKFKIIEKDFRKKYKEGLKIRTKCGTPVRSRIERTIMDFLTDNGFVVYYETSLNLGSIEFHPDFYIPSLNLYIEHWGKNDETRRKKEEAYKKHGIKYFSTEESDVGNIYDKLKSELSKFGVNKTDWK